MLSRRTLPDAAASISAVSAARSSGATRCGAITAATSRVVSAYGNAVSNSVTSSAGGRRSRVEVGDNHVVRLDGLRRVVAPNYAGSGIDSAHLPHSGRRYRRQSWTRGRAGAGSTGRGRRHSLSRVHGAQHRRGLEAAGRGRRRPGCRQGDQQRPRDAPVQPSGRPGRTTRVAHVPRRSAARRPRDRRQRNGSAPNFAPRRSKADRSQFSSAQAQTLVTAVIPLSTSSPQPRVR